MAAPALSPPADSTSGAASPRAAASSAAPPAAAPIVIESKVATASTFDVDPFKARTAKAAPVPGRIVLPAPVAKSDSSAAASRAGPARLGAPTLIGNAREVAATAAPQQVAGMLGWSPSASGGRIAALRFQSTGAKGVRVGLLVQSLPLSGVVRFYSDGSEKVYEVANQEIQATIQRNTAAGDTSDAARTFWSPDLGGEAITVEFEVPANVPTDAVQVSIPRLSHIFADASKLDSIQKVGAGTCNLDISCTSAYDETSKSVAKMNFVADGSGDTIIGATYLCTGTLLNDAASSGTPYFLSANHCISTQTVASTLWTYWFYKSAACNSTQVDAGATLIKLGATLLYASPETDTSFMRLAGSPPPGAVFAASKNGGLAAGSNIYGVHHPAGDLQKYSVGTTSGAAGGCTTLSSCSIPNSVNFWQVGWSAGMTEGGSSGSGLFTQLGGKNYLVGQLYGGYASCSNPTGAEYYGRFDSAYNQALYLWLGGVPGHVPVYRFYNTRTGTHFYTTSSVERDSVIRTLPQYSYDGISFYASNSGADPVFRFYNTRTGAHFYTNSTTERDSVIANYAWYKYEGPVWYASGSPIAGSTPMYRFYNSQTASHFYTTSAGERDTVLQRLPQFGYEGVAYYAWLSP